MFYNLLAYIVIESTMARGTKGFFDSGAQRTWVFNTCRRNGLDNANPEVRWCFREYYRIMHNYYAPGTPWFLKKYGWSGIGEPPDWVKQKLPPPPEIKLDPNALDPPTFEQISKFKLPRENNYPERFWDDDKQKKRVYAYVHDHHPNEFNYNDPKDQFRLREMDRSENGFYQQGGEGFGLPKGLNPHELSIARRLRDLQKMASGKKNFAKTNAVNPSQHFIFFTPPPIGSGKRSQFKVPDFTCVFNMWPST